MVPLLHPLFDTLYRVIFEVKADNWVFYVIRTQKHILIPHNLIITFCHSEMNSKLIISPFILVWSRTCYCDLRNRTRYCDLIWLYSITTMFFSLFYAQYIRDFIYRVEMTYISTVKLFVERYFELICFV